MGITLRTYLIDTDGKLRRLPRRVIDDMVFGCDAIPEFASTTQRIVSVVVENDRGKPIRLVDARGEYWKFDDEGKIRDGLREANSDLMKFAFSANNKEPKVVSLVPEIKRREFHEKHRWEVTKDILDRIAADIWPGVGGPAEEVSSVKGKAPKRPSLSHEATEALREIEMKLAAVHSEIASLSDHSLKGLAFEARRTAEYGLLPALWLGVAEVCERQRRVLQQRRTGKGTWYAVLDVFYAETPDSMRSVMTKWEKCEGREAAVNAARRLLGAHADCLDDQHTIEARIATELEWIPSDDD